MQLIERDTSNAKKTRKAFPSPADIAHTQAEKLSNMLHSREREFEGLERLKEIEGVPGFEGCEGLEGLEAFGASKGFRRYKGFKGLTSIQSVLNEQPLNALTLVTLISLERARKPGDPEKLTNNYFAELGKRGGTERQKPMAALKAWTLEKYKAGRWDSNIQAATTLKAEVIAHGRTINANLTETNAQRTIAKWISEHLNGSGKHLKPR